MSPSMSDPYTFYLAPSTGGLWKTVNNGTTFKSILPDRAWCRSATWRWPPPTGHRLGRARATPLRAASRCAASASGNRSDAGKTWTHMGLTETRHIGRIAIHPTTRTPSMSRRWATTSSNPERGLYKTTDGGKTWAKALFRATRSAWSMSSSIRKNPAIVFASTYDKQRIPWNFDEGGPESGIYRSTTMPARPGNGWPAGCRPASSARIGLAIYPKNPEHRLRHHR